jgi:hypothetical protein
VTIEYAAAQWDLELDDLFLAVGHRFGRVELRRRMRDSPVRSPGDHLRDNP